MDGEVTKMQDDMNAFIKLEAGMEFSMKLKRKLTGRIKVSIRPEQFIIGEPSGRGLEGEVSMHTFLGDFANYEIKLSNSQIVEANEYTKDIDFVRKKNQKISLTFDLEKISVFNEEGTEVLS
jgi:iron(III) transport system ATP-binding protein